MKVPPTPPASFTVDPSEHLVEFQSSLWRIFRTQGSHLLAWNQLRHHGPVPGQRFDPHPLPRGDHPSAGVMYTATSSHTALAEVYQDTRVIDRAAGGPTIVSWRPSRPLVLLNLTTNWPVVNDGAAAMMMIEDKTHTQTWARAINDQLGDDIDGLYHLSSITGEPLVTLFNRVERVPAIPARPDFHELLTEASTDAIIHRAIKRLHYRSV